MSWPRRLLPPLPSQLPSPRPRQRPSRSIDGLVAEHYRRAGSRGHQRGLRGPARARVHAIASTRARAGAVPVRLPSPAAPVPVRAPPAAAWDATVDRYLAVPPVAVLPRPARRSRDDMMFDLQVKNILCCLEGFNNVVPEDDNDNDGTVRRLGHHRKLFCWFNIVSRILDHMNINSQCD